jgi:hypothetical protein
MRRIDQVKNKKIRNIKYIEILDKNSLKIVFKNISQEIILRGSPTDYGYDSVIYIEKDNIERDES